MKETAYYYPPPLWLQEEGNWIKTLLLFFDEIAILLPDYMYGRHRIADPVTAGPLEDLGLLRILEPKEWVDEDTTRKLAGILHALLTNGVFDDLPKADFFLELSQSRIGYSANIDLAELLVDELRAKNLARNSEDGVSIPLHPDVRTTILVILAQLFRVTGTKHGLSIHPASSNPEAIKDLLNTLKRDGMVSRDNTIKLDIEPISINLDSVPLEDILQFRADHKDKLKAYVRDLRGFMTELADIDDQGIRERKLKERRKELSERILELQLYAGRSNKKNLASWSLGIAGGAWSVTSADPIGLAMILAGLSLDSFLKIPNVVSAYTYLVDVHRRFGG